MRKITLLLCALLALAALPVAVHAAAGEWTGWITDEQCAAKGAKDEHKGCAEKCYGSGEALVFYHPGDGKLYKLDKQELAKEHLGHEVVVKGSVEGDAIKVAAIEKAEGHSH
jgi:hypothetical protein